MSDIEYVKFATTLRSGNANNTLIMGIPIKVKTALNLKVGQQVVVTVEPMNLGVKYKE